MAFERDAFGDGSLEQPARQGGLHRAHRLTAVSFAPLSASRILDASAGGEKGFARKSISWPSSCEPSERSGHVDDGQVGSDRGQPAAELAVRSCRASPGRRGRGRGSSALVPGEQERRRRVTGASGPCSRSARGPRGSTRAPRPRRRRSGPSPSRRQGASSSSAGSTGTGTSVSSTMCSTYGR